MKSINLFNSLGEFISSTDEGIRNFWKWFGNSVVVDSQGSPLVVNHNSKKIFSKFNADNDEYYFSKDKLKEFGNIEYEVYLKMENPFILNDADSWSNINLSYKDTHFKKVYEEWQSGESEIFLNDGIFLDEIITYAKKQKFDGVIAYNIDEGINNITGTDDYIVFNPNQIKSKHNEGLFNPYNNNIYK